MKNIDLEIVGLILDMERKNVPRKFQFDIENELRIELTKRFFAEMSTKNAWIATL